jgi:hypothetical protein
MTEYTVEQRLEQLKKEYCEAAFVPLHTLYVDLEMLQDFRIGALLSLITTEPEYQYILHRLPSYGGRYDNNTMKHFPVITDITDSDIDNRLADVNYHSRLARTSPMTLAFDILKELIAYMHCSNRRCEREKDRLTITIGTNSVIYDQAAKKIFIDTLTKHDKYLDVTFLNRPLWKIEPELIFKFDIYMFYNLATFMQQKAICESVCEKTALLRKRVYAYPILEKEPTAELTAEEMLHNTKLVMDVVCDFVYVDRGLQEQV